jgi:hypothetical protein
MNAPARTPDVELPAHAADRPIVFTRVRLVGALRAMDRAGAGPEMDETRRLIREALEATYLLTAKAAQTGPLVSRQL